MLFRSFLKREIAWKYVHKADVCVSPFYPTPILNSTSPTKLVEYMAMGKPVVANDHPEQSNIITESKCGLCVPYEESAFAQAIVDLLSDPKMAHQMGLNGRSYIEKFRTYSTIADHVERQLIKLLESQVN